MRRRFDMIDAITQERIIVHTEGTGSPYLMVANNQLTNVTDVLRCQGVPYWVDEDAISLDDEPAVAIVNLGRGANVASVQHLLDSI
jgi:hypothetical protein